MPALEVVRACANLKSRFFDGLAPQELQTILGAAKQRHYAANSVITNQGNPADHVFLVARGRARYFFNTEDGSKVLLLWLTPGDTFGGAALVAGRSSYIVSAEALKDSLVMVWDRATIQDLAARYPRLMENALLSASDYLALYVATHVALISQSASQRVARILTCLAATIGEKVSGGFEFDATNEELAGAANVTPYTVSRLMSEWQRNRALIKRRGKILLRSPERLFLHTV